MDVVLGMDVDNVFRIVCGNVVDDSIPPNRLPHRLLNRLVSDTLLNSSSFVM